MLLSEKRIKKTNQLLGPSRRLFFKQMSSIIVGSAVLGTDVVMGASRTTTGKKKDFTGEELMTSSKTNEFSPYLGDLFMVCPVEGESQKLELIEVEDRSPRINRNDEGAVQQECFSLLFKGALEKPLPQNTYTFKHSRMGTFALFIVPVGKDSKAMQYEAVINRLLA